MRVFVSIFVLFLSISFVFGKGGSRGGGSHHQGSSSGGQSHSDSHSSGGNHQNTHSNGGSHSDSHMNGGFHSSGGSPPHSGGSHGSNSGSQTPHPHSVSHHDNNKPKSSSKTALAGGLLAGGLLGYAAGSHMGSHHGSHKNSSECNKKKLPSSVNETSCCPGIPPQIMLDTSCDCEKNDTKRLAVCVIECTLENEGWLDGNGTIDSELVIESILNKATRNANLWKDVVTSVVNACFRREAPFMKDAANETAIARSQIEIMMCITQRLIRYCPTEVKNTDKVCKKFYKFVDKCEDYPFLD